MRRELIKKGVLLLFIGALLFGIGLLTATTKPEGPALVLELGFPAGVLAGFIGIVVIIIGAVLKEKPRPSIEVTPAQVQPSPRERKIMATNEKLEALRDRFLKGEISEDTYKDIRERIEEEKPLEKVDIEEEKVAVEPEAEKEEARPPLRLKYCPSCGGELKPGWKVCGYCGKKLESGEESESNRPSKLPELTYLPKAELYECYTQAVCPSCEYEYEARVLLKTKEQAQANTTCPRCNTTFQIRIEGKKH